MENDPPGAAEYRNQHCISRVLDLHSIHRDRSVRDRSPWHSPRGTRIMDMDLKRLAEPFPAEDIEWRIGRSGKGDKGFWATALAYLTNRAIMQRLDDVCGPHRWRNEYREWHVGEKHGVLCGISIKVDEEWVTKWDGAENTDIESIKGGLSDS